MALLRRRMMARALAAALIGLISFLPAAANDANDANAIRNTIESQLKAFLADDADQAYSFAAPNIKSLFPTADVFMSMVKRGYQPVYRPQSYLFGDLEDLGTRAVQFVEIIGPDGGAWTARYTLERQSDGSWKITGCSLLRLPDLAA